MQVHIQCRSFVLPAWHREGELATVEYEGAVDYAAVLSHYMTGFAAQGYAHSVQSATRTSETHQYTKERVRNTVKIAQLPKGGVSVRIETATP